MRVDVAVIVVGMNSRERLLPCLQSLAESEWRHYSHRVIYVDNASSDDSVERVGEKFPEVRILANSENLGFCRACNQGAAAMDSRYIYLLNNDTTLFPESLCALIAFLDREAQAGAAANRLLNPDLTDQWSARRFPRWSNALLGRRTFFGRMFAESKTVNDYLYKDCFAGTEPFRVDWAPGSCTLIRRSAFEQIGGLPENMHYWSDAVFCDRLGRAGWPVYVLPDAPLIHDEGMGTGGKTPAVRRWLISDFHNGAYRFYCEHYGLGVWSAARIFARFSLGLRAQLLMAADWMIDRAGRRA